MEKHDYITTQDIIAIIERTPSLQSWITYDMLVTELTYHFDVALHILYGLAKRCRLNPFFDAVQLRGTWFIKLKGNTDGKT